LEMSRADVNGLLHAQDEGGDWSPVGCVLL
jgi:hypothetical protein